MARLSGFFTAFNISVSPSFKNNQFRFFSERFYTSADSFISKNEGMAEPKSPIFDLLGAAFAFLKRMIPKSGNRFSEKIMRQAIMLGW